MTIRSALLRRRPRPDLAMGVAEAGVRLAGASRARLPRAAQAALRRSAAAAGADGAVLLDIQRPGRITVAVVSKTFRDVDPIGLFPWIAAELLAGRTVDVADTTDLPADSVDLTSAAMHDLRAILALPLTGGHGLALWRHTAGSWNDADVTALARFGRLLDRALRRPPDRPANEPGLPSFVEDALAIIWRADAATFHTQYVSREVEKILGFPTHVWLERPDLWLSRIHPEDREWVVQVSAESVRAGRKHDFEYRMTTADGRTVWLRNIVNVVSEAGAPAMLVGVTTDITARKQAEMEVDELRAQLAHVTRVTALGELAATLAHELNQPLGAIASNAESAQALLASSADPATIATILAEIERDSQRGAGMIRRMRSLVQRDAREHQPLELLPTLLAAVETIRPLAARAGVAIRVLPEEDLPAVWGDAIHIQQVALNLILNAIDAMQSTPDPRHLVVSVVRDNHGVRVSVADTGAGIALNHLHRVFEPFFTTKRDGLGMGLPICRSIVEAHSGRIWAENNTFGGATVHFTLPPLPRDEVPHDR